MTGGRGERRGPASRRDFGSSGPQRSRDAAERPSYDAYQSAEVEDVSTSRTMRTSSPRIGVSGILAVLALAVLLAGGFGLMGGHTPPTAKPSQVAQAPTPSLLGSPTPAPPLTAPPIVTEVVPWTPCVATTDEQPIVRLEGLSVTYNGAIEILATESGAIPTPPPGPPGGPSVARVEAFTHPDIWIVGAHCALSWKIEIVGFEIIDIYTNAIRDPRLASQNRFDLELARFGGLRDVLLRATLVFPTYTARASWRLDIDPWPRPRVLLRAGKGDVAMSPGCDVENAYPDHSLDEGSCDEEIRTPPASPLAVRPGQEVAIEALDWILAGGWSLECGNLDEAYFSGDGTCDGYGDTPPIRFTISEPGRRIVRASFCGYPRDRSGADSQCFTWFGLVDVRPGQ